MGGSFEKYFGRAPHVVLQASHNLCRKGVSCGIGKVRKCVTIFLTEATSEPKFPDKERTSLMRSIDPITLHIHQTDETTMRAVQLFARQVVLILHTCNVNEYWAALERLEPPTKGNGSNIRDHSIIYPHVGSVVGWFAGYRAAVVLSGQGNKCRDELMKALTESFQNGKVIVGAGIVYTNNRKRKFADVLISDQVENFVQYKKEMKSQTVAHVKRLTQTYRESLRIQQGIGQTCSGFLVQTMVEPQLLTLVVSSVPQHLLETNF